MEMRTDKSQPRKVLYIISVITNYLPLKSILKAILWNSDRNKNEN